jgi:hypothetical protein
MAGKWRVKVQIADNEAILLKFQSKPTEAQVAEETNKYIANFIAQQTVIAEETEKMDLIRNISLEDLKIKLRVKDAITLFASWII